MISGVVLAAGSARRFGATKQLAILRGRPLLQHAIDAVAAAGVDELLVVTGHDAEAVEGGVTLPDGARFVRNPDHALGQSSSLAAGLHALDERSEGAVVVLADQPGVDPDHLRAVIDRFRTTRARVVRLAYRDGPGPSLLSREVFGQAGHLTGDVGARVLIASHPEWLDEVEIDADAPRDVDRPEDLPEA